MTDKKDRKRAERAAHKHNTLFTTAKDLADNPQSLAENIADTAGGSNIPDPSDIPGVGDPGQNMMQALEEDVLTKRIGKKLGLSSQQTTRKNKKK